MRSCEPELIMTIYDLFFYMVIFGGFLMAFNLGANDVAKAIGIVVYWVLTVPIAAFTSILFYHLLYWLFF